MRTRTRRICLAAALAALLLAGCQCSHEYDGGAVTKEAACLEEGVRTYTCQKCGESYEEAIPALEHDYSDRVTKEPTYEEEGVRTFTCSLCRDSYQEPIPALEKPVAVTVTAKRKQYNYLFKWVELDFSLENLGETDIRGCKGELVVRDVFGKELLSRRCQFTEPLPAGETVAVEDLSMLIDDYDEMEKKFYETYLGDLQFFYKLEKVVFAPEEEEEKIALEGPVTVRIDGLHPFIATPQNRMIGSSMQLSLSMINNTGKEIEGVDGTLIFLDMFGEELASKDCPLMRAKGHFWEGEWGYTLHFDINDFSSSETTILYTEFQDLNFAYSLSSILFEDGTQEFFQTPDGATNL